MDEDRLTRGLETALDMVVDDEICAVLVIGVHADCRGVKVWTGGDECVADQVKTIITKSLPFTPSPSPSKE